MTVSRIFTVLLAGLFFCAPAAFAQQQKPPALKPLAEGVRPGEWTLDLEAAKKSAAEKNLPLFLFFTVAGNAPSDKAKTQVFMQPAWRNYAKDNLVLVWVDL